MSWLIANWMTIAALLAVAGLVALSLRNLFPGKGKGSACGGCPGCTGCAGCASGAGCAGCHSAARESAQTNLY